MTNGKKLLENAFGPGIEPFFLTFQILVMPGVQHGTEFVPSHALNQALGTHLRARQGEGF